MERINALLFSKVHCPGYLKKVYDGRFIEVIKGDVDEALYTDTNNLDFDLPCECDGSLEFLKTYYEEKAKSFSGFVVGFKDVIVTGYLVAETNYNYIGQGYLKVSKAPKRTEKCAIVYFASNRKRLVPLSMIEGKVLLLQKIELEGDIPND
ncbi:MAG: hypothetical protein AB9836_04850 [Aminipila sp.]